MTKIIAVSTSKGGVAKSTTTWHLGAGLSKEGKKVLIIDIDQQQHISNWLSQTLAYERLGIPTISELIYQEVSGVNNHPLPAFIQRSSNDDLDFIPANKMLGGILNTLAADSDSYSVLNRILRNDFFSQYDFILIDCPTSFDLLVTNAHYCCDSLLIPVQPEYPCYDAIPDVLEKLKTSKRVSDITPYLEGFLVTMFDKRTNLAKEVFQLVQQSYPDFTFDTPIPFLSEVKECVATGVSVVYKSEYAGAAYRKAAAQILKNHS